MESWSFTPPSQPEQWSYFEDVGKRYFYKTLCTNGMPPVAFRNQWEINCAILANFAVNTHCELVFDAEMFVKLEIDPVTWKRASRPKNQRALLTCLSVAIVTSFIFWGPHDFLSTGDGFLSFIGSLIALLLVGIVPFALLDYQLTINRHPQFAHGGIVFKRPK